MPRGKPGGRWWWMSINFGEIRAASPADIRLSPTGGGAGERETDLLLTAVDCSWNILPLGAICPRQTVAADDDVIVAH